ncbi:hypothetical protein B0H10DRAFT_1941381 [Mycena sp. CBHHK59/15]|nr:hypothetical protein B0H10DRAFT_1941381 [Mycena sp. CBHHK59/15]
MIHGEANVLCLPRNPMLRIEISPNAESASNNAKRQRKCATQQSRGDGPTLKSRRKAGLGRDRGIFATKKHAYAQLVCKFGQSAAKPPHPIGYPASAWVNASNWEGQGTKVSGTFCVQSSITPFGLVEIRLEFWARGVWCNSLPGVWRSAQIDYYLWDLEATQRVGVALACQSTQSKIQYRQGKPLSSQPIYGPMLASSTLEDIPPIFICDAGNLKVFLLSYLVYSATDRSRTSEYHDEVRESAFMDTAYE